MKVLIVEDDKKIATAVKRGLEAEGFTVDVAFDGTDGLWLATEGSYDLIVLDLMLPGLNGFQVCGRLREAGDWTPILVLTAKDGDLDEAEALDTGADDYLMKPFSFSVLVARIRALLRRAAGRSPAPVAAGDLRIDPGQRRAWRGEDEVRLTARQFQVLEFLMRRAGQVLAKDEILAGVWEYDFDGDPNIVEVYIRRLRRAIDEPFESQVDRDDPRGRATASTPKGVGTAVRGAIDAIGPVPDHGGGSGRRRGRAGRRRRGARRPTSGFSSPRPSTTALEQRVDELAADIEAGPVDPASFAGTNGEDRLVQLVDASGSVVAATENVVGQPPDRGGARRRASGSARSASWRSRTTASGCWPGASPPSGAPRS